MLLVVSGFASATAPGGNGKVFYEDGGDIYSINPDGSGGLDLTAGGAFSEQRPNVSADGQQVVFQTYRDGGWNVFSMGADGSGQTNLTKTKEPVVNFEPTWSPDGTKVAFMRQNFSPGEQDIWVVDAGGTNPVNLTKSPGIEETAPEFSPDGTRIVYISTGPKPCCTSEYNNDIWVMNADGSGQTQLTTTDQPTQNIAPTWSPDATKIAYSRTSASSASENGLRVLSAGGGGDGQLLNGSSPIPTNTLSWSPDGASIVYQREGVGGGLLIVGAGGGASTPLVSSSSASYPSWAPVAAPGSAPAPAPGSAPVGSSGSTKPSNKFKLGKPKLNEKTGTATLTIDLPGPGKLVLRGKGIVKSKKSPKKKGRVRLRVKPTKPTKRKLSKNGKARVTAKITFTPSGGTPRTKSKALALKHAD